MSDRTLFVRWSETAAPFRAGLVGATLRGEFMFVHKHEFGEKIGAGADQAQTLSELERLGAIVFGGECGRCGRAGTGTGTGTGERRAGTGTGTGTGTGEKKTER